MEWVWAYSSLPTRSSEYILTRFFNIHHSVLLRSPHAPVLEPGRCYRAKAGKSYTWADACANILMHWAVDTCCHFQHTWQMRTNRARVRKLRKQNSKNTVACSSFAISSIFHNMSWLPFNGIMAWPSHPTSLYFTNNPKYCTGRYNQIHVFDISDISDLAEMKPFWLSKADGNMSDKCFPNLLPCALNSVSHLMSNSPSHPCITEAHGLDGTLWV